ncbi:hypothetical protein OAJ57_01375 [Alphaproteobacteria bacterium]|nr:hypothetical protein [Alphaproteobacteria bacterium]
MSRLPQTETGFSLIGLGPEAVGAGLQLQVSKPTYNTRDGKRVVTIKGFVVNISEKARVVPGLIVKVFDKNKEVIFKKHFSLSTPELLIKQRIWFTTDLIDPPPAATGIEVAFDQTRLDKPATSHP